MEAKILALAQSTDTTDLCLAWGLSRASVMARKNGERPLTVKEVGALAYLHKMTLAGILSI